MTSGCSGFADEVGQAQLFDMPEGVEATPVDPQAAAAWRGPAAAHWLARALAGVTQRPLHTGFDVLRREAAIHVRSSKAKFEFVEGGWCPVSSTASTRAPASLASATSSRSSPEALPLPPRGGAASAWLSDMPLTLPPPEAVCREAAEASLSDAGSDARAPPPASTHRSTPGSRARSAQPSRERALAQARAHWSQQNCARRLEDTRRRTQLTAGAGRPGCGSPGRKRPPVPALPAPKGARAAQAVPEADVSECEVFFIGTPEAHARRPPF